MKSTPLPISSNIISPPPLAMHSAMDQTRNWMWERNKVYTSRPIYTNSILTPLPASSYDSWEEFAFARDSASDMWGCVWPPRSYSCSFCWREFRSAQALGGHMNVHRRDRARLKLEGSSSSTEEDNSNPNPNSCPKYPSFPTPQPQAEVSMDLKLGKIDCKRRKEVCGGDEALSNYKKLKSDDRLVLDLRKVDGDFIQKQQHTPDILKHRTCHVEDLDLELRLGDAPKLKQGCSIIVIE